jgi:RNA polymerase sigma-70 factor (ECF subfamily)
MKNQDVLYKKLSRPLLKFILKRNGGDLETAQAVIQDTFVAAFRSFHTFRHKSSYFTWLCRIALNKLADYYRQQVHARSRIVIPSIRQLNSYFDPVLTPEEKLSLDELRQSVNACLDLLPDEYRRLLHLKYYQQLSSREICLKFNLTPRQLEGRLYRARHALARVVTSLYPHLRS